MRYAVHNSIIDSNPAQDLAGAIATTKRVHRPALPFERITELLSRIESYRGRQLTRLAVRLTLLTFVRSSEMRFARWSEIDFKNALWTIPAEREELQE
jgi:integrase